MIFIMGRSASGKDTIVNKMVERGFKKMVTYTTRPIRKNETQDITYHFVNEDIFKQMKNDNKFLECKFYNTIHGVWYYGSALEDYEKADKNTVVIITPSGYQDFLKRLPHKEHLAIYVDAEEKTIHKRLINRGDNPDEVRRRMLKDIEDFKYIQSLVDVTVYNDWNKNINELVNEIIEIANRTNNK